jgi:hypothetical protein
LVCATKRAWGTAKAFQRLRVTSQFCRQKLQSYKATQPSVFGLINDTHPAAAELLDDAVMGNGLADHADAMLGALQWEVNESNGLFSRERGLHGGEEGDTAAVGWPVGNSSSNR